MISLIHSVLAGRNLRLSMAPLLLLAVLVLSAGPASAACRICFSDGVCFDNDGDCADFNPDGPYEATCENCAPFNPNTDYILLQNGQAWVVTAKDRTQVLPDSYVAFMAELERKYPEASWKDPKVVRQAKSEFQAFRKRPGSGAVSRDRLQRLSRETGLRIVEAKR